MERLLEGKAAILTGAGQGLGREIALVLARHGCNLMLNDINQATIAQTTALVQEQGVQAAFAVGSASDRSFVKEMYAKAAALYGKLDIVVNNAAINRVCGYEEITDEEFTRTMDINVRSILVSCQEILPYFKPNGAGKIINIASAAGKRGGGGAGNAVYAASKGAVMSLTKTIAREVGPFNINCNCVSPGFCEVGISQTAKPEVKKNMLASLPLGRQGRGADIGNAVVFLASDLSDYITGEMMDVDGGLMCD